MEALKTQVENLIDNSQYNEAVKLVSKAFNIKLKVLKHTFKSHTFDKDGQKRNVFKMQLSRGDEKYIFDFGQSTSKSCKESNEWEQLKDTDLVEVYSGVSTLSGTISGSIKFKVTKLELQNLSDVEISRYAEELKENYNNSTKEYNKKQKLKAFHINGMNHIPTNYIENAIERTINDLKRNYAMSNEPLTEVIAPTLYDILACLQKYDVGTFEDFCDNFGYDTDSRTALKTYKAVVKEYDKMCSLFNNDELEVLQCIC